MGKKPRTKKAPLPPAKTKDSPLELPPADLNDPNFRTTWQNWTAAALGRLDQLPKLSQQQLDAIAQAAAGAEGQNPGIDLPASLAALFEAKLTLDREKAKLVKMQKELKGYKDGNGKGKAVEEECTCEFEEYEEDVCYDCDCDCHECDHEPRISDDPERLDSAVRELFNWIKAVVWTIEQAAMVAKRR